MTTPPPTDTFDFGDSAAHNQAALAELTSAIAFGQGADMITLLLVRCNYEKLRDRMVAQLLARLSDEDLQGPVPVLRLSAQDRNLYAQVRAVSETQRPGAVLVVNTEGVTPLETLLVEMNKRREEFRRDFPFPLVLWFTDDGYHQLSQHANDFESVAGGETIEFVLPAADLVQALQGAAQRLFAALLDPNRTDAFNQRLVNLDRGDLRTEEVAIALADLQAQGHALDPDLQASVTFAQGLNCANPDAIPHFEQSAAHWQTQPDNPEAQLKQGLALYYLGRSRYFVAETDAIADWASAVAPLTDSVAIFEQAQRPDLVAPAITQLAAALYRLERWDALEALTQKAVPIHQAHGNPRQQAQDQGFLAAVAAHRQQWQTTAALAQQALDTMAQVPQPSGWRLLYLKLLAAAAGQLGQTDEAIAHLQAAQALGVLEQPQLYSQILSLLQGCLRDQGRYLDAFEIKRERLAIEKQYGLRAFIGAGRLRAQRTEQQTMVRSQRKTLEEIAPEITTSGRAQDLTALLNRIAGKTHKLLVLHGVSGVGKSSLVNGGLLPALQGRALENRDNVPVLIRQYTDWPREVATRLDQALSIQNSKFPIQNSEARHPARATRSQASGVRSSAPRHPIPHPGYPAALRDGHPAASANF